MQIFHFDLSKAKIGEQDVIRGKQGDVGRKICIELTDNETPYTIPEGTLFSVHYAGSNGAGHYTHINEECAFAVSGNTVTVELIAQMFASAGSGDMCLVLNDTNGNELGLWNLHYLAEPIPGADSEEAQQYYNAFAESVAQAMAAADSAQNAAARMDAKEKKRYVFISDSYDAYSGWANLAAALLEADVYTNLSISGGGLVNGTWNKQLLDYSNSLSEEDRLLITDIILCGGINDSTEDQVASIGSAISTITGNAKTYFPNASVKLGYIGYGIDTSSYINGRTAPWRQIACGYYQQCARWGAEYLCGVENILHNLALMNEDGIHPNSDGGIMLASHIAQAIRTGHCSVSYEPSTVQFRRSEDLSWSDLGIEQMVNGQVQWLLGKPQFPVLEGNGAFKLSAEFISVGQIRSNYFQTIPETPCRMFYASSYSTMHFKEVSGSFKVQDGQLYLKALQIDGTSYDQITVVLCLFVAQSQSFQALSV